MSRSKQRRVRRAPSSSVENQSNLDPGSTPTTMIDDNGENIQVVPLPLEVVNLIMEVLDAEEERRTLLQAAAMVSRVWCRAAQAKIFYAVEINCRESCQFWSRKFKHSPHLGEYVRDLELSDPNDDCLGTPYLRTSPARGLASALTRLQSLALEDFVRWGPVEQRLVKRFQSVTALSVADIHGMKGCRDLPDLLYALPNVEKLTLSAVGPVLYDFRSLSSIHEDGTILRQRVPDDDTPRRLRNLCLREADLSIDILMWLTGPAFDLSKLDEFTISWSDFLPSEEVTEPDFSFHDQLFRLVGGHVTVLDLGLPTPNDYENGHFRLYLHNPRDFLTAHLIQSRVLENFTALKKITLDAEWSSDLLPYLVCTSVALLKTLKAPQLRIIELVSGFNARTSHRLDETCEIPEWKHLDDVLSGDTFPYLTLVDLTVNLGLGDNHWFRWAYIPPPVANVREAIQDCLPQTALKGLLQLNVCDYHD